MNFQKKLIDTITTSNFYLKSKEHNENDMDAQVFWPAISYSSQRPSQIGPTAHFDSAGITPLYFPWVHFNPNWGMLFVACPCINSVIYVNWNFQGDHQN